MSWYFSAIQAGDGVWSLPYVDSVSNEYMISFTTPVYSNNNLVGVAGADISFEYIRSLVVDTKVYDSGYAFLLNSDQIYIADKHEDRIGQGLGEINGGEQQDLASLIQSSGEGVSIRDFDGEKAQIRFVTLDNGLIIGILAPMKEVQENLNNIILIAAIIALVGIGASIVIGSIVSSLISKPLEKVTLASQQIAEGNFDVQLAIKSKDEVGRLAKAFNRTIAKLVEYQEYIDEISESLLLLSQGNLDIKLEKEYGGQFKKLKISLDNLLESLNSTMFQINQASTQVNTGAEQVALGAQAISQSSITQSQSVQQLSAYVAELVEKVKNNEAIAKEAQSKAGLAGDELKNSNEEMKNMVAAMEQITQKASQISHIIKIIDDIAFQTNILALNAAIEAARAGSAGKGFAVVADEVRNLAAKSAEAANNITTLIGETIESVKDGSETADRTAVSLKNGAAETLDVVSLVEQIAMASEDQAEAVAEINQEVLQISTVVDNNAATAEESAAASQELSGQSDILNQAVSVFRLKGEINNTYHKISRESDTILLETNDASPNTGKY